MSQPSISSSLSPVHLRDVQDKVGKLQPVPTLAQRQLSLLLLMVVVVIVIVANDNIVIIIIITIIRTAATQRAGLARWRDLPQATGYVFAARTIVNGTLLRVTVHVPCHPLERLLCATSNPLR